MGVDPADAQQFQAAVKQAIDHLQQAITLLEPFLVQMTSRDRAATARTRVGFEDGAKSLLRAMEGHPELATAAQVDANAVLEQLNGVNQIKPLLQQVSVLQHMLSDSTLSWNAEALSACLAVYRVAKAMAKTRGELSPVVLPLAKLFVVSRKRSTADE